MDAPNTEGVDLFGMFYDKKDVHYQVSKVRRDQTIQHGLARGAVKPVGFDFAPCPELAQLRAERGAVSSADATLGLEVCIVSKHGPRGRLVVPDPASLPFIVPETLKHRLDELTSAHAPAKRRRAQTPCVAAISTAASVPMDALASSATKVSETHLHIAGRSIPLLRMRTQPDGASEPVSAGSADAPDAREALYFSNQSAKRIIIPALQPIFFSASGSMSDRSNPDCVAEPNDDGDVITWPWTLGFAGRQLAKCSQDKFAF